MAEANKVVVPAEPATTPAVEVIKKEDVIPPVASTEPDYKAELALEKERTKKAEGKIVELKRELKNTPVEDLDDVLANEDLDKKIDDKVEQRVSALTSGLVEDFVNTELDSLTTNPDEKELMKYHYENTIRKTGLSRSAIKNDLGKAKALANSGKIMTQNAELHAALVAKKGIVNSSGSNQDKGEPEPEFNGTPAERKLLERSAANLGLTFKEYIKKHPELLKRN